LIAFSRVFFWESESKTLLCSETETFSDSLLVSESPLVSESISTLTLSPPLPSPLSISPFSIPSSKSSNSWSVISRDSSWEEPLPFISESECCESPLPSALSYETSPVSSLVFSVPSGMLFKMTS